jgi:hypothetical protein
MFKPGRTPSKHSTILGRKRCDVVNRFGSLASQLAPFIIEANCATFWPLHHSPALSRQGGEFAFWEGEATAMHTMGFIFQLG